MQQPPDERRFAVIDASRRREAKKVPLEGLFERVAKAFARSFLRRGNH
jgi:hypothetical protein